MKTRWKFLRTDKGITGQRILIWKEANNSGREIRCVATEFEKKGPVSFYLWSADKGNVVRYS